ncbi:transposase, partial [Marinobacter sp.]|uniref:transposase n=5 Tax=Marinobacter sp. TaxID=50741 RepID=UPI0032979CB2
MSGKRYSEEFKIEAVKQVTERGYKVTDVCRRLGITSASLHKWIKLYGDAGSQHQQISEQQDELRKLRAELRRVSEERDILKKAAVSSTGQCKYALQLFSRCQVVECFPRPLIQFPRK